MIAFIKRILASLDFKYQRQQKEWHDHLDRRDANLAEWLRKQPAAAFFGEGCRNVANDPEYMATRAAGMLNMAPAAVKARRLAEIARDRNALKEKLAKAVRDKKARAPIYQALRALSVAELRVEMGEK
jgi:hypothetical protein